MTFLRPISSLLLALLFSSEVVAVKGGPELDRNLVSMYGEGEGEIWGQVDYVDDSFINVFGYESKSSGLNYSQAGVVGGKYGITERFNLRAQYGQYRDEVWRTTEPKITRSQYKAVEAVLQDIFYVGSEFDLSWSVGYREHSARDGEIRKFQFSGYLIEADQTALTVSGLAVVNPSHLTLTQLNSDHTLIPQGDDQLLIDDEYQLSQTIGEQFAVNFKGVDALVSSNRAEGYLDLSAKDAAIRFTPDNDLIELTSVAGQPLGQSRIIESQGADTLLIDNSYSVSQLGDDGIFYVNLGGTNAAVSKIDADSLQIQSGDVDVEVTPIATNLLSFSLSNPFNADAKLNVEVAPSPTGSRDIVDIPNNAANANYFIPFAGAQHIFLQKEQDGAVKVYSSNNAEIGDGDDTDITDIFSSLLRVAGGNLGDLSVLIDVYPELSEIESSVGILNTPEIASRVTDLNQVISALKSIDAEIGMLNTAKIASRVTEFNQLLSTIDTRYIVRAEPADRSWQLGLNGAWYASKEIRFTIGAEVRQVYIEPNYRVNPGILKLLDLYQNMGLGTELAKTAKSAITDQLPQESGWDESHLLLSAGIDWDAYEDLSFAAQYTYYTISRSGYHSTQGKVSLGVEDQTSNHQLDGWIFVKPTTDLTFYLHGRAYSNFLLGDRPLLYNARVNHKFTDPYGFVSVGAVWEF